MEKRYTFVSGKYLVGFSTYATLNINYFCQISADLKESCDVLHWDATHLPLRTGCVDRVICDMPFGVRCGMS